MDHLSAVTTAKKTISPDQMARLIEAGDSIKIKLERLPKKKAQAYQDGFNRLRQLIDKHSKVC